MMTAKALLSSLEAMAIRGAEIPSAAKDQAVTSQCGSRTRKPNSPGCVANRQVVEISRPGMSTMSTLAVMAGFASHRRHNAVAV